MLKQEFSKVHLQHRHVVKIGAIITLFSEQYKAKYCVKKQITN